MTSPADQPPPEPERGDPVRLRWFWALIATAAVCAIVACALAGPHVPVSWVPPASVGAAAVVLVVIAFVVLAGGKEKQ